MIWSWLNDYEDVVFDCKIGVCYFSFLRLMNERPLLKLVIFFEVAALNYLLDFVDDGVKLHAVRLYSIILLQFR
jgi:hypothetical protein